MTLIEEVYKGCSSFAYPSPKCDVILGINVPTCAATFDAEMNLIGYGESSCFSNYPNPALTQECENEDDYCITDLEADWFLNGRQEYRIRRGCSEKVILNRVTSESH